MYRILKFLGLAKTVNVRLDKGKKDVISKKDIKPSRLVFFDIFDSHPPKYYGIILDNEFRIRPSGGYGDSLARAHGIIKNNNSDIEIKISAHWFSILFAFFIHSFLFAALIDLFVYNNSSVLPVVFLATVVILIWRYRTIRGFKSFIKKLKSDLNKLD